jgi:hypothetical protein
MCLWSLNKGVGSGVGSGSVSQRYGSGDLDPHQNVKDPTLLPTLGLEEDLDQLSGSHYNKEFRSWFRATLIEKLPVANQGLIF